MMGFVDGLAKIAKGAVVGVAAVTALPLAAVGMGGAGIATALGTAVGAGLGAAAGIADEVAEADEEDQRDPGDPA